MNVNRLVAKSNFCKDTSSFTQERSHSNVIYVVFVAPVLINWKHNYLYTKEKPYKCELCDYEAARTQDLKKHLLRHSKEKTHKCEDCNYRGATAQDLKRHLERNTKKHRKKKAGGLEISKYPSVMQSIIEKYVKNNSAKWNMRKYSEAATRSIL